MNKLLPTLVAVTLMAASAGCDHNQSASNSTPPTPATSTAPAVSQAPAVVGKMITTKSGLKYEDTVIGKGAVAAAGQTVSVHYTGTLQDGTKFDSSRDRGQPIQFTLGTGQVIPGWDEGIAGMKVGGQRKLVIPPDLAYGAAGHPPVIPENATLLFDVELVAVQ